MLCFPVENFVSVSNTYADYTFVSSRSGESVYLNHVCIPTLRHLVLLLFGKMIKQKKK